MSLVGSLEDLGLGDILQIVSLSRKSGLLLLRSDAGEGRIFFRDGLVQAATIKGEAGDLAGLLEAGGFLDSDQIEGARAEAEAQGKHPEVLAVAKSGLTPERLDALRREQVERCVLQMFAWCVGEFSFEIQDQMEDSDAELALPVGINALYLTMEATRLGDETGDDAGDDDFMLSGEISPGAPGAGAEALAVGADVFGAGAKAPAETVTAPGDGPGPPPLAFRQEGAPAGKVGDAATAARGEAHEALAQATAARVAGSEGVDETAARAAETALRSGAAAPSPATTPSAAHEPRLPLVVIDPELPALEWMKAQLEGCFTRIHIFQHSEDGIVRVRQYLGRAQTPVVLVSTAAPADTLTGSADGAELLGRLRAPPPRMPIVALHEEGTELPPGVDAADALVTRPAGAELSDPRGASAEAASEFASALRPWAFPSEGVVAPAPRAPRQRPSSTDEALVALKEVSDRLRDPATRGEVLNLVLDFAAKRFRRVAMFMVTDEEAVGMAQRGLAGAGGPDDAAFRALRVPLHDSAWLRRVLDRGESLRAGPSDAGDRRLVAMLGASSPLEAFVAPIETGGRVAAIVYADDLPESRGLGDTTVVSIVLHEAGLALDRAVLERALEEAGGGSGKA